MSVRAEELHSKADDQVGKLIDLVSAFDDADLRRPCPGREKLGDGSVGTLIAHTADNYLRIAALLGTADHSAEGPRSPRDHGHGDLPAAGGADAAELRRRLTSARTDLSAIAALDDRRLDSIPPEGAFRFCDGKRNLEEVLAALLTHQGHQVEALGRI